MATFGLDDNGYDPIDSIEFLELQMRSKLELDQLINNYRAIDRKTERTDHALTQARQKMLREIRIESNIYKDEKGNGLIYWDKILMFAKMAVEGFNKEDIQRGAQ